MIGPLEANKRSPLAALLWKAGSDEGAEVQDET